MIFWGTAVWCRRFLITFTKSRKKLESHYRFWSNIVLFSLDRFLFKREFAARVGDGRLPQHHFSLPTEQWRADQNPPRWALPADSSQRGRHAQREFGHADGSGTLTQHCTLCYPAGLEGPELLLSPLLPSPRQEGFDSLSSTYGSSWGMPISTACYSAGITYCLISETFLSKFCL